MVVTYMHMDHLVYKKPKAVNIYVNHDCMSYQGKLVKLDRHSIKLDKPMLKRHIQNYMVFGIIEQIYYLYELQ